MSSYGGGYGSRALFAGRSLSTGASRAAHDSRGDGHTALQRPSPNPNMTAPRASPGHRVRLPGGAAGAPGRVAAADGGRVHAGPHAHHTGQAARRAHAQHCAAQGAGQGPAG